MSARNKSYRKSTESKSLHVRLPNELVDRLDAQADFRCVSRALMIERAIEVFVKRLEAEGVQRHS